MRKTDISPPLSFITKKLQNTLQVLGKKPALVGELVLKNKTLERKCMADPMVQKPVLFASDQLRTTVSVLFQG